jgi:hypothetical protein
MLNYHNYWREIVTLLPAISWEFSFSQCLNFEYCNSPYSCSYSAEPFVIDIKIRNSHEIAHYFHMARDVQNVDFSTTVKSA